MPPAQPGILGKSNFYQLTDDLPLTQKLQKLAKEKFPKKWEDITRRYGAVEYVTNVDYTDLEDIISPVEYLQERDRLELERWGAADHGVETVKQPLSSRGLVRLVQGLLARSISEWELLHGDPEYMYRRLYNYAQRCPETIKNANGESQTPESLLAKPLFVAMRLRTTSYNALLDIGGWSVILEYLRELETLDREKGRFGALLERGLIIGSVKALLDHMLEYMFSNFMGNLTREPVFERFIIRQKDHPDFLGSVVSILWKDGEDKSVITENSLKGTLLRALNMTVFKWNRDRTIYEVSRSFGRATAEEKSIYTQQSLQTWSDVEMAADLMVMLGSEGGDWKNLPYDERYIHHALMGRKSEAIFKAVVIEKHISNIESLRNEGRFRKIWAEIDKLSMKREKKTIEKVTAFAEIVSSWSYKPPPPPAVPKPEPKPEVETKPVHVEERIKRPKTKEEIPEIEPVKLQPVSYLSDVRQADGTNAENPELPKPKGQKQKTRGTPKADAAPPAPKAETKTEAQIESTMQVGKEVYEVLQQLLVRVDRKMNWSEVEKMFTQLGFGKAPTGGSCISFSPPSYLDITFVVDRPHDHELEKYQARNIGKQLKKIYNWTIDMFTAANEKQN